MLGGRLVCQVCQNQGCPFAATFEKLPGIEEGPDSLGELGITTGYLVGSNADADGLFCTDQDHQLSSSRDGRIE